jgi:hypothetical protein
MKVRDHSEGKSLRLILKRAWIIVGAIVFLLTLITILALGPTIQALVRERTENALGAHFASKVEFSDLNISLLPSIHVRITGLVMRHRGRTDIPPLIQVREVSMYASLPSLFRHKPHISLLQLSGLQIHTPPREPGGLPLIQKTDQDLAKKYPVLIEEIHADDAIIVVLRARPEKPPREYPIHNLELNDVSFDRPSKFHATLTNAVPRGEIDATGEFGPWLPEDPSETPVRAQYTFQDADLGTFKGLRGTLSSRGQFAGPLDYLTVEGETNVPDFGLRTMGHPVALRTDFSALVDGTNGDVILKSVKARFLHTSLAVSGEIVDVSKEIKGRTILLNAVSDDARIEDLLRLAVNSDEPVMTGFAKLKTNIQIPEGDADLLERLKLDGQFGVGNAQFTSPVVQGKIDTLSRKGQGQPKDTGITDVVSELSGNFKVRDGAVTLSQLRFAVAGASLELNGTYSLDSTEIELHGKLTLQAKLSQTTTGAKSFFLKVVDLFFKGKNGGTELPIKITGPKDHPLFGLDRGGDRRKSDEEQEENTTPRQNSDGSQNQ